MTTHYVVKSIRDPVHGFLYLTPIEQVLVDQPEFQRLRFVLQQSTAYQTFPSNTTNRFAHSCGAAHLSGQMFLCALTNASAEDCAAFREDTLKLISTVSAATMTPIKPEAFELQIENLIGDPCLFLSYPPVECLPRRIPDDFRSAVAILWQSVRLATLVHDLGHLPMSHLFEDAIGQFDPNHKVLGTVRKHINKLFQEYQEPLRDSWGDLLDADAAIHEMIGCMLFHSFLPTAEVFSNEENRLFRLVSWIAKIVVQIKPSHILPNTPEEKAGARVLRFLHSIIAGEIDADRLDYSVRDPLASSSEFGNINLRRLVRGQVVVRFNNEYRLAMDRRAVIDIESFFIQRYFAFRTIVSDHNVSRSETIIRQVIEDLVIESANPASLIQDVVGIGNYDFWHKDAQGNGCLGPLSVDPKIIGRFDDTWLRSLLYSVWRTLTEVEQGGRELTVIQARLRNLIDITLHRKILECWTLAKTDVDSFDLMREVETALIARGKLKAGEGNLDIEIQARSLVEAVFCTDACKRTVQECIDEELGRAKVDPGGLYALVNYEHLKFPKDVDSDDYAILVRGEATDNLRPLGAVSPLLSAISQEVNGPGGIPRLRIFLVGARIRKLRETTDQFAFTELRQKCVEALATAALETEALTKD